MCTISEPTVPEPAALRAAQWVSLARHPDTAPAEAFTRAVTAVIARAIPRKRPLGSIGLDRLKVDVGAVLGGLMRPGLQGAPVRAHRSPSGDMWRQGSTLGCVRFWVVADAMIAERWLGYLSGVRTPGPASNGQRALAPAIWPLDSLIKLAASHGVTADTRKADWRADAKAQPRVLELSDEELVTCLPKWSAPFAVTPQMDEMRRQLKAINAVNAAAGILGAGNTTALAKRFLHSTSFGGRAYASVSSMGPGDRTRITMGGLPVIEVDLTAAQLTVLLGLTGAAVIPLDPYAVTDLPRDVVKRWVIQSLGSGRPTRRWSDESRAAVRGVKASAVWAAIRPFYPFLENLPDLVPEAAMAGIPIAARGVAAGQWLVSREAAIIIAAMIALAEIGIPVLPIHDSLIVPVTAEAAAVSALCAAFVQGCSVTPRFKVTRAPL